MNHFSIYLSLLVCIVGAVIWIALTTPKPIAELGRLAYFAGLLTFLLTFAGHVIRG